MKKILLLFIIAVSLGNVYGQDVLLSKFYAGAKLGYGTIDFVSTDPGAANFAERTYLNLSYGIVAGYRVNDKITVQAEAVYAQYSANNIRYEYIYRPSNPLVASYSETSYIDHVDMDLYYIDIPVIAKYQFGGRTLSPYAYVGVNWGINMEAYAKITRATEDPIAGTMYREYVDGITEQIRYNEFAPVFGGGLNMNLGDKITLFGDLRYKFGVQNISNVQNGLGFKNNALWLSAGAVWNFDF
jgi:hypothetical protein